MYSELKSLLQSLELGETPIRLTTDERRVAIAVVYYQVVLADGRIHPSELSSYRDILANHLQITEDELNLFEKTVVGQINGSGVMQSLLDAVVSLGEKERLEILTNMHSISMADKELHEYEIALLQRTARILGISDAKVGQLLQGNRE